MPDPASTRLDREQLLSRILSLNPSATTAYLNAFSIDDLQNYLDHLRQAHRGSIRLRPAGTKAVVGRESRI